MFEIIGAIILIWFAIGFLAELCTPRAANHNRTNHHAQRKCKDRDKERRYGWIKYVPAVQIAVLLYNPDYGLKK